MSDWCVYILRCRDNSLYTGITNNLSRRLKQHNKGTASKYTRSRLPVKVVKTFPCKDRSEALRLEYLIKRLPRGKKLTYGKYLVLL